MSHHDGPDGAVLGLEDAAKATGLSITQVLDLAALGSLQLCIFHPSCAPTWWAHDVNGFIRPLPPRYPGEIPHEITRPLYRSQLLVSLSTNAPFALRLLYDPDGVVHVGSIGLPTCVDPDGRYTGTLIPPIPVKRADVFILQGELDRWRTRQPAAPSQAQPQPVPASPTQLSKSEREALNAVRRLLQTDPDAWHRTGERAGRPKLYQLEKATGLDKGRFRRGGRLGRALEPELDGLWQTQFSATRPQSRQPA